MPEAKQEPEIVVTGQKQVVITFAKVAQPVRLRNKQNKNNNDNNTGNKRDDTAARVHDSCIQLRCMFW